jgi:acyl-homoserine-lactone acylase
VTRLRFLIVAALLAGTTPAAIAGPGRATYDVKIRTTAYGIPHIEAGDYASLGYGYGYSVAAETICTLADVYTTVRAQRSRYFGPDAGYTYRANGSTVVNVNSDFFYQQVIDDRRVEKLLDGPGAPKPQVRDLVDGYVDGYNRWLADVGGASGVTDPACKGAPWVTPIEEIDAYRRFYQLALLASSGVAIDGIGAAQPPTPSAPAPALDAPATAGALAQEFQRLAIGSNAVALGSEATDNGRGMLLGNPHFPWTGSERFFQAHLTIPGRLDVAGGSLLGVPIVLIGHTAHQAWSHTVSTSYRFTPFQETLVPGSPTTYLYDGVPTAMTSRTVSVKVLVGDRLEDRTRTLWSTKHGPVFTSLLGIPLPWTPATAFTMGDANAPNFRYLNHFFDVNHAQSARAVLASLKRHQGIPWVNTIAADDAGDALYADISVTPHVTDDHALVCDTAVGAATFAALRLPVLDGARSACEWGRDADAVQPGTFGPSSMPSLIRRDYVTNSNDSFWLANPEQPLEGYAEIIGDERTERTTRTRSGLVMVAEKLADGGTFGRQELQDILYANRQHAWELTKDDLLTMCRTFPGYAPSSSGPVAVGNACAVLAAWDGRDNLDSRGALLFRRFWTRASAVQAPVLANQQRTPVWAVPFDAADPVHTPRGLNVANPLTQRAFGDALTDLSGAGIPVDAPLGQFQVDARPDGTATPYFGGPGALGVFNAMNATWNSARGYVGPLQHGSSFIQVVSFDGDGCPDARTILTYSQSTNPSSPHYADQTRLYAQGGWVTDRFCKPDVRANTLRELRLRG